MDKHAVSLVLNEIGTLMELLGENRFRARAFFNAGRALDRVADDDAADLLRSGALEGVRGFGPATIAVVRELAEAGTSSLHRELRGRTPDGLIELLGVPGLGARRIHTLHEALGIAGPDDLERAAREGRIATLSGFGEKTQANLLEGVAFLKSVTGRRRQPDALEVARRLQGFLDGHPSVARIELAGALRRRWETVDAVELVASVPDRAAPVLDAFLEMPGLTRGERVGEQAARARLADGFEVRIGCVPPDAFAAVWVQATGSAAHVDALAGRAAVEGLRLNEYGLWRGDERVAAEDEASLYAALGLPFVAPELREGRGEVEAALAGTIPAAAIAPDTARPGARGDVGPTRSAGESSRLLTDADLRGCFHCHTTYSDGKASVAEMAEAARALGWRYLGVADHSRVASYAGGLSVDEIARQHEEIDAWNAEHGDSLWLFKGIEADILPDGRLDYADEEDDVLARFDYVVGSIHSSFGLPAAKQTKRVLRALEDPNLTFLGHATGRLLLSREGYGLDLDAVIEAAAERGVGIEINANPRRLELDWRHWRRAGKLGVKTAINPDAHSTPELDNVRWGVGVARKGWLGPEDVVNAWDVERVEGYFGM